MIEIVFDHSQTEDYWAVSHIDVNIKDLKEKERIETLIKNHNLENIMLFPNKDLQVRIAEVLQVDVELIQFDTNEIDLM